MYIRGSTLQLLKLHVTVEADGSRIGKGRKRRTTHEFTRSLLVRSDETFWSNVLNGFVHFGEEVVVRPTENSEELSSHTRRVEGSK